MADTYDSLLQFRLQESGGNNNTWGQLLNIVIQLVAEAISGMETVAVTGGTDTLTAADGVSDQARNAALKFTGVLASNETVVIPSRSKIYVVWNATSGNFTLTVKTSGGTGAVVTQGAKVVLFCDGTDTYAIPSDIARVGKQTLFIPAAAMRPTTTNGCGSLTQTQITSGKPEAIGLLFDSSTAEFAQLLIALPKSWNEGTITAKFIWTANDATTNGVAWTIEAVSMADGDALAGTYGAAVTVVDNNTGATYRNLISSESAEVTVDGSPAAGELQAFRIGRNPAHGSDDLAVDAILLGVQIFVTTDAGNDA